jgi:rhodanese-related sulfurtransferase
MGKPLIAAVLLALSGLAGASPQVSGDGACGIRAVDNESFVTCSGDRAPEPVGPEDHATGTDFIAPLPVSASTAWQIKRDLAERVLMVDIRARPEIAYTGMPLGVDANVPFIEPAPAFTINAASGRLDMDINVHFLDHMDRKLSSAGLGHGDPVILLCRSGEQSRTAAKLMNEHGYLQVFVVAGGFEGDLAAGGDGTGPRRDQGWKSAGLPWTFRLDPHWLHENEPAAPR